MAGDERMTLCAGTKLGPYEILAPLGAGGMGKVYKARDTRLDRTVAIKVLREDVAQDADARARFTREARAISSLDHPHICALYDVGEHEGAHFLVMQYLEGQTLAERLSKGAMPIEQVLQIGIQVASALDRAHCSGITHRDLKPGNVMLTKSGGSRAGAAQARLLDFGLAKLRAGDTPVSLSAATRLSEHTPTAEGTILGTIYYMAPEQVEGREADARSDIFALGSVLYELITGRRPFEGSSPASVMGAILKDDPPPVSARQPVAPPALDHVVRTCLAKDPDDRWQSAADVKRELEWIASAPAASLGTSGPTAAAKTSRLGWIAAVGVLLAALAIALPAAWRQWFTPRRDARVVRFEFTTPWPFIATGASVPATQLAVSPDGRNVAFVAGPPGSRGALWVRALGTTEAQQLAGTEDALYPFWSPDSRYIGFFAQSKLKKVDVAGNPPVVLCNVSPEARGGTWNRDDVIVFSPGTNTGLLRISAGAAAEPTPVLNLRDSASSYRWPSFLPDGRHFLYFARAPAGKQGIYVGSLDGGDPQPVIVGVNYNGAYAPPGYLLTLKDGTLLAYSFDARTLKATQDPARVIDRVGGSSTNLGSFSAAAAEGADVLVFAGQFMIPSRLEWFDRAGRSVGTPTELGDYVSFRLSPDDRQVAFSRVDRQTNTPDIYLLDVARGVETRFTSDPNSDVSPIWSPDGRQILFRTDRAGGNFAFIKPADGSESERPFGPPRANLPFPADWSADGAAIAFHTNAQNGSHDVVTLAIANGTAGADAKLTAFAASEFNEIGGAFSPDGRWLAYASDASTRMEVYVAPFPRAGGERRISVAGGSEPHWRRDGRELFYLAPDRTLMAVDVTQGPKLETGTPHALFKTRAPFPGWIWRKNYDVTADGSKFLVTTPLENYSTAGSIGVVLNWTASIRK